MFALLYFVFKGHLTLGQMITMQFYSFFIFGPLQELGNIILAYREAQASLSNFDALMNKPVEAKPASPIALGEIHSLQFDQVSFQHKTAKQAALNSISFSVEKGKTIAFVGPSGSGKTTLVKLLSKNKNFHISVSHTTRKPRPNEIADKDYYFVNHEKFETLIKNEEFLEYEKVFNHLYGTTRTPVIEKLEKSENVIFDIDWQGADQIKNKKLNYKLITFFILPPSKEVLFERLSNRHTQDKLIVEERMKEFTRDVLHWINYDYVIINDNLEECYSKISNLIDAEVNNGSKDYDKEYIRKHVEKLTF